MSGAFPGGGCGSAASPNAACVLSDHPFAPLQRLIGAQNTYVTSAPDTAEDALTGYARRGVALFRHGDRLSKVGAGRFGAEVRTDRPGSGFRN